MNKPLIFHIDVNSAFLSWESIYRLEHGLTDIDLRTVPSAVGGDSEKRHGIILAKSIPAKRFGVQTGEPVIKAMEKCPELIVVSPHFSYYGECSAKLMKLFGEYSSLVVPLSIDEAFLDMTGSVALFGEPMEIADKIRKRVRETFGFTVNIGVSTNKFLAKMASDFKKPDLCHSLFPEEIPAKLWPLPVSDLYGAGKSTVSRLSVLGLKTIGDVAATDKKLLISHFGKSHGESLYNHAHGIDNDVLAKEEGPLKGYGNSITLSADITDTDAAKQVLLSLSETVGARLRAANVTCASVTVELKDANFVRRSHQCPLLSATNATDIIYRTACKLLSEFWHNEPIRLLGIRTGHISEDSFSQMNLFDFDVQKTDKLEKLDKAMDSIRDRFGTNAVMRASFLKEDTERDPGGKDRRSKLFGQK